MADIINGGGSYRGLLPAGHLLHILTDAGFTGFFFWGSISADGDRLALAESSDVMMGPFSGTIPFRIDCTTGMVGIDTDAEPTGPLVIDKIGASAAIDALRSELMAVIDSRLSEAQRAAIDELTELSDAEAIVAALQAVAEPEE